MLPARMESIHCVVALDHANLQETGLTFDRPPSRRVVRIIGSTTEYRVSKAAWRYCPQKETGVRVNCKKSVFGMLTASWGLKFMLKISVT